MKTIKYKLIKAVNKDKIFYVIKEDVGLRFPNWVICFKEPKNEACIYYDLKQAEEKFDSIIKEYEFSLCGKDEEILKQYEV